MNRFKHIAGIYIERIYLKNIVGIIIGAAILAASVQIILIPAYLLNGGIAGVATVLQFITGIKVWIWYSLINIPIFVAGYRFVNRRFVIYSLIGTASLSIFLGIFSAYQFKLNDIILATLFGGALAGIGSGIIFRSQGSSGGLDIIAVIIKKKWGYNISQTFFVVNLFIIGSFILISNLNLALFSIISMFVSSQVMDKVLTGAEISRTAMIISRRKEAITQAIIDNLHRGCTFVNAWGGYTGEEQKIVITTVGKTQLPLLREVVLAIDPQAFMIIHETIEVYGRGFKSEE